MEFRSTRNFCLFDLQLMNEQNFTQYYTAKCKSSVLFSFLNDVTRPTNINELIFYHSKIKTYTVYAHHLSLN